jgi:hypothetical protein
MDKEELIEELKVILALDGYRCKDSDCYNSFNKISIWEKSEKLVLTIFSPNYYRENFYVCDRDILVNGIISKKKLVKYTSSYFFEFDRLLSERMEFLKYDGNKKSYRYRDYIVSIDLYLSVFGNDFNGFFIDIVKEGSGELVYDCIFYYSCFCTVEEFVEYISNIVGYEGK